MDLLNTLIPFIVALIALSVPVFIIIAILHFARIKHLTTPEEKAKQKKKAWTALVTPFVILLVVIVIWGLLNVMIGSFQVRS